MRSRRSWFDDRLGTASKSLRATEAPSARTSKLGPDQDDAANEGDFEGLRGGLLGLLRWRRLLRCECEKSVDERVIAATPDRT